MLEFAEVGLQESEGHGFTPAVAQRHVSWVRVGGEVAG